MAQKSPETAGWFFTPQRPQYKSREAFQGQFFATPSIETVADSVVREAVQNTLDAHDRMSERPRIVFRLHSSPGLPAAEVAPFLDGLWPHLDACREGAADLAEESCCRTLVIEDFNTRGLVGDPARWREPEDRKTNDFYYFFRAEGKSSKSGATRGSWGIGKFTFVQASEVNTFFGFTHRIGPANQPGGVGPLVMGEAIMTSHLLDGEAYTPDGWWAVNALIDDFETPMPATSSGQSEQSEQSDQPEQSQQVARFEEVFKLDREGRPGLSVVVPYVRREMDGEALRRAIVKNYAVAVSQGLIEIELVVEGTRLYFNTATIDAAVQALDDGELMSEVRAHLDLVRLAGGGPAALTASLSPTVVEVTELSAENRWKAEDLPIEIRQELMTAQASGRPFVVRVPVAVEPKDGERSVGVAVVAFTPSSSPAAAYYRGGLRISEVSGRAIHGYQAIVLTGTDALAAFLGDAEGPSHVNWSARTERFSGKYAHGLNLLAAIKNLPSELLRAGRTTENNIDRDLAINFFRRPREEPPVRPVKGDDEEGGEGSADVEVDAESSKVRFVIARIQGGFRATVPPEVGIGTEFTVRCAYGVRAGNPLKRWSVADFDLAELPVVAKGCDVARCEGNTLSGMITDVDEFRVEVVGFDGIRDLFIDAVLVDEPADAEALG